MSVQITLQADEAATLEALLDKILTSKGASDVLFDSGADRRAVKRVSMKLLWSKQETDQCNQDA